MADKTEHTAERLVWDGTDILDEACNEVVSIEQGHGHGLGGATLILTDANARRLVAAWNACKGIETETLEKVAARPGVSLDGGLHLIAGQEAVRADAAGALLEKAASEFEAMMYAAGETCGDPWAECPLQDAHKDYSTAGTVKEIRAFLNPEGTGG